MPPCKHVVLDDLCREIAKEQLLLFFVDIETDMSDVPRLEAVDQGGRVDQRASARVDDHHSRLHLRDRRGIDHVPRVARQRRVQRHDVGLRPQLFERPVVHAEAGALRIDGDVVRENPAAEAAEDPRSSKNSRSNPCVLKKAMRIPSA